MSPVCDALGAYGQIVSLYLTASIEHLDTPVDYYAMTPLHAAVSRGHCATAAVLTGFGANVNAVDSDNMTPLHYAAKNGHSTCTQVRLLRVGGAGGGAG